MIDESYYRPRYKTAESRALYLVIKKSYGTFEKMAEDLDCSRQYIDFMMNRGVPVKYAGYLGRKWNFTPVVLCYELLIQTMHQKEIDSYETWINGQVYFSDDDKAYILAGTYIRDPVKWLRIQDKQI